MRFRCFGWERTSASTDRNEPGSMRDTEQMKVGRSETLHPTDLDQGPQPGLLFPASRGENRLWPIVCDHEGLP
jgi:hypothetical protein